MKLPIYDSHTWNDFILVMSYHKEKAKISPYIQCMYFIWIQWINLLMKSQIYWSLKAFMWRVDWCQSVIIRMALNLKCITNAIMCTCYCWIKKLRKAWTWHCNCYFKKQFSVAKATLQSPMSVCQQNPSTAWKQHPSSLIIHPSSSLIHPSQIFIHHSSFILPSSYDF